MIRWIMTCVTTIAYTINMDEERHGYFKGRRGLREGDHTSPYMVTLVLEVFSLLIARNIQESVGFMYQKGCKELKLTHLCFIDDLLVLSYGNATSVKIIKKSLMELSSSSCLLPNLNKSSVFFCNVNIVEKQEILNVLPFRIGHLPGNFFAN
ncbi:RNA-directed DNA polymerase, eukaryota, reverse transcriptase zinc-binding domain protein [Tanacetum coccineum]